MEDQQEQPAQELPPPSDPDATWSVPKDDLDATWPVAHLAERRAD